jgi:hypothetical protein
MFERGQLQLKAGFASAPDKYSSTRNEIVTAAGPPATQRLNFRLMTDFKRDRKAAERLAGISSS